MSETTEILSQISIQNIFKCIFCCKKSDIELPEFHVHEGILSGFFIPRYVFRWVNRNTHDNVNESLPELYVIHMLTEAYVQRHRREHESPASAFKCITCDIVFTADHVRNTNSHLQCAIFEYYGTPTLYELMHKNEYPIPERVVRTLIDINNGSIPIDESVLMQANSDIVKRLSKCFYEEFQQEESPDEKTFTGIDDNSSVDVTKAIEESDDISREMQIFALQDLHADYEAEEYARKVAEEFRAEQELYEEYNNSDDLLNEDVDFQQGGFG